MAAYSGILAGRTPAAAVENPSAYGGLDFSGTKPAPVGGNQDWTQTNSIVNRQQTQAQGGQGPTGSQGSSINPQLAPFISSLYGQIGNNNQPTVTATTKDAGIGQGVAGLTANFNANSAGPSGAKQSLADFTTAYLKSQPQANQYAQSDINSINQNFGTGPGSVAFEQNKLLQNQLAATRDVTQQALSQAARANSMNRLANGHGSGADQLYANSLAGIMAQAQQGTAQQAQQNYMFQRQQQNNALGSRNKIEDSMLQRSLMPSQVANQLAAGDINTLGGISNLQNSNTFYNYQTPEQQLQAKLAGLSGIMNLSRANTLTPLEQAQQNFGIQQLGFQGQQLGQQQNFFTQAQPYAQNAQNYALQQAQQGLGDQQAYNMAARPLNLAQQYYGLNQAGQQFQNQQALNQVAQPLQQQQALYGLGQNNQQFQNQKIEDQQAQANFNRQQQAYQGLLPYQNQFADTQNSIAQMQAQQQLANQQRQYAGLARLNQPNSAGFGQPMYPYANPYQP